MASLGAAGGLTALSYVGSAACCCGSAAISCCSRRCSSKNSTVSRIAYAVVLLLITIVAWLMLSEPMEKQLVKMDKYSGTPDSCIGKDAGNDEACQAIWGQLAVYRVMFGSTMFFGLMSAIMIGVESSRDKRAGIQNGWWGPKFLLLVAFSVAAFFIKNDFFLKTWGWIGLFGGFCFLIVQLILLIDFAHAWADDWVGKIEEGSAFHKYGTVGAVLGMYLFALAATVLMYVFYTKSDGSSCGDNKFFISVNLISCIICTAVAISGSVQEVMPNSGLLQSGVVVTYVTYLTWSAISETHADSGACQPSSMEANDDATTVIGAIFTFIAVAYSSMRTTSASTIGSVGMNDKQNAAAGGDEADRLVKADAAADDDDELDGQERGAGGRGRTRDDEAGAVFYNWCFFHLSFVFASLYLMMVLTDWGVMSDRNSHPDFHVGRGKASTWVKIVSSWLSALLYIWSLIAPICLPNRDFN